MRARLIFLLCLLLSMPVYAQEKQEPEEEVTVEDIFQLVREGKVVTSTKTERALKTVPHAVSVITRRQIQESGATTLSEALRVIPGVNARTTAMGSQIGIRSFGSTPFSERVLFLIDGTPYNSPDKGGYPGHPAFEDFFPIEAVKRIEVIKGPGSALYGQNAFFGIINIITDDFKGTNTGVVQGGSRSMLHAFARGGGEKNDWTYTYLGKYKQQDGPMRFLEITDPLAGLAANFTPSGLERGKTDVKSGDIYLKAANKNLSLSYLFHRDETGSYNWFKPRRAPNLPGVNAGVANGAECCASFPTEQTLQFADATYHRPLSNGDSWQFKAFYNRRKGNTCANCHFNSLGEPVLDEDEINQRFFLNTQYDMIRASHKIIFGADAQFDNTSKDIAKLAEADNSINTFAGYVQDEITLMDEKLIATLGVRVDHNEKTDTSVSPSVSVVVLPSSQIVFRALYGRAFRQPTWNDLFTVTDYDPVSPNPTEFRGTGVGTFQQRGNSETTTEQMDTFEFGVEYFFTDNTSVKFDGYFNHVTDLIEAYDFIRTPPLALCTGPNAPPQCNVQIQKPIFIAETKNLPDEYNSRGFELEFRFRPAPQFSTMLGYAYQDNDFDRFGATFINAYSPEHKWTAAVNVNPWEPLFFNFSLNYWSSYNSRTFLSGSACGACTNTDPIGQAYTYSNLKALVRIPVGNQRLGLGFTVKNLFDEELQLSHAFRVDSALYGREYFGSVEFDF